MPTNPNSPESPQPPQDITRREFLKNVGKKVTQGAALAAVAAAGLKIGEGKAEAAEKKEAVSTNQINIQGMDTEKNQVMAAGQLEGSSVINFFEVGQNPEGGCSIYDLGRLPQAILGEVQAFAASPENPKISVVFTGKDGKNYISWTQPGKSPAGAEDIEKSEGAVNPNTRVLNANFAVPSEEEIVVTKEDLHGAYTRIINLREGTLENTEKNGDFTLHGLPQTNFVANNEGVLEAYGLHMENRNDDLDAVKNTLQKVRIFPKSKNHPQRSIEAVNTKLEEGFTYKNFIGEEILDNRRFVILNGFKTNEQGENKPAILTVDPDTGKIKSAIEIDASLVTEGESLKKVIKDGKDYYALVESPNGPKLLKASSEDQSLLAINNLKPNHKINNLAIVSHPDGKKHLLTTGENEVYSLDTSSNHWSRVSAQLQAA